MPRASGKTTMLIKESAETGKPIIVSNNDRVCKVVQQAKEMGLRIPEPVSARRWILNDYLNDKSRILKKAIDSGGFLIDELDHVLGNVFGAKISKATYTPEKMNVIRSHKETQTLEEFESQLDEVENLLDRLDKAIDEMSNEIGIQEIGKKEEEDNMRKFKVGDLVRVKSVDEMKKSKIMIEDMEEYACTNHYVIDFRAYDIPGGKLAGYILSGCNSYIFEECMLEDRVYSKDDIFNINVIVPDKVVEIEFCDGKEKMVCHKDDTFDLRKCCFIAIAKHLYKKEYTQEGIEHMATQLTYQKKYVKIVDKALKDYKKKEEEKAKKAREEEEQKIIRDRQSLRRWRQKQRRISRRNEERNQELKAEREEIVSMMAEAINRAKEERKKNKD